MLEHFVRFILATLQNAPQRSWNRGVKKSTAYIAQKDTATVYVIAMTVLLDAIIRKSFGFRFLVMAALWTKFPNRLASLKDSHIVAEPA